MKNYEYLGEVPAKPTTYKNVQFKSKLEAQWAEFFDALNLPWQYEKDKIALPDGTYYVSDFTLHNKYNYAIYEMKPKGVTSEKFIAARDVINKAELNAFLYEDDDGSSYTQTVLLQGSIYDHYMRDFYDLHFCYRCGFPQSCNGYGIGSGDCYGAECLRCDWNTPSGGGNPPEYSSATKLHYTPHKGCTIISEEDRLILIERMTKAAERIIWPDYYKYTTAKTELGL